MTQPGGVVDQQPRGFDLGGGPRELELHALELGDRLAELLALPGVAHRVIERRLRQPDHLRADADPPFIERLDRDLVPLADLAEHVRARHTALLEQQLAGAAGADPELVFLPANRESRKPALDDEGGDPAVARLRIQIREDDEDVGFVAVGDPELAAIQHEPTVARLPRRSGVIAQAGFRREREGVAAGTGFGQRVSADRAAGEACEIRPLLLVMSPAQQRVDDQRVLHVDQHADRRIDAGQRLDGEHGVEERAAGPAEGLGHLDAHDAELEQRIDEVAGDLRLLVHVTDVRADFPVGKLVHAVAKEPFVLGKRR